MTLISKTNRSYGAKTLTPWVSAIVTVWTFHFLIANEIDPYFFGILMYAGVNIILALSLNLVNGFTGQFSMGHAGFMSVGAYTAAFITTTLQISHPVWMNQPWIASLLFIMALVAGGLSAAFTGCLVGLPSLRLRGDYLAIVTLGFGEIIRVLILNMDAVGGARGLPNIPLLSSFGWIYTFVVVTTFTMWRMVHSSLGREFLSVREDEIAAQAMGVDTTQAKVRAFTIGAFFAGIGGGLFAHFLRYINPQTFDFNRSFEIIIMVVLGGMGSLSGSIFAAILLTGMKEALRPLQELTQVDFRMIIYSLMLILLMLTRPNGLFGTKEIFHFFPKWLNKKLKRRQAFS